MGEIWLVLVVVAAALVFVIRHYVRAGRCESSACGGCGGGCTLSPGKIGEIRPSDDRSRT